MATSIGVYYPSPEADAKFTEILHMFKNLSPAIHERLQNPNKGFFGGPKKASRVNRFNYYNNPSEEYPFDQVQLLKEWYMTVNVLLNEDEYKSYIIDEIKDKIDDFKSIPNIYNNIKIILTPLVDKQYNEAMKQNIKLDRSKLYIINALNSLMDNFAPLKDKTSPVRIQSLALNTTTNGKKYNIEQLHKDVVIYVTMIKKPTTLLSNADRSVKSLPQVPTRNTRSNMQNLQKRLAALKEGGKHRKHRLTKKRSVHKKKTQKRRKY